MVKMVKSSKGALSRRTRTLKGKSRITIAQHVKTFKVGEKVVITPKARGGGLPHLRYSNRHGIIIEKRGKSYVVEVGDLGMKKQVVIGPVHMKLA